MSALHTRRVESTVLRRIIRRPCPVEHGSCLNTCCLARVERFPYTIAMRVASTTYPSDERIGVGRWSSPSAS